MMASTGVIINVITITPATNTGGQIHQTDPQETILSDFDTAWISVRILGVVVAYLWSLMSNFILPNDHVQNISGSE